MNPHDFIVAVICSLFFILVIFLFLRLLRNLRYAFILYPYNYVYILFHIQKKEKKSKNRKSFTVSSMPFYVFVFVYEKCRWFSRFSTKHLKHFPKIFLYRFNVLIRIDFSTYQLQFRGNMNQSQNSK